MRGETMTREMNKPDWHYKWIYREIRDKYGFLWKEAYRVERKLDDWIKPYIDSINERFKQ